MRILLDTHVYLWVVQDNKQYLTTRVRDWIGEATEVYVSSASIWEAVIKIKLNKLHADIEQLTNSIEESGFLALPITVKHAAYTRELPDIHKDPFDRMLVAQAMCEPLKLLTNDGILAKYSQNVLLMS